MKTSLTLMIALMTLTTGTSAFAKRYGCDYASIDRTTKKSSGSGKIFVEWSPNAPISVTGSYSSTFETSDTAAVQPAVDCHGPRRLPETKAAYFKIAAVYDFDLTDKKCSESSIRVHKNAAGVPDMQSVVLVNYRGDNHDSSGYQSAYFTCHSE